jgi:tetratricopeptide (TPR) repeat protein/tRNA A-37 threonylcarbamoyl transferase component Bud32
MDPREATNRDLLIALLALQNGLVDQATLVAAFHAWTRDKSRPIADVLATQGAIDGEERILLEGLAQKHLKRHGGAADKSLAALNSRLATREDLAKIGDAEIVASLVHLGPTSWATDADDSVTVSVGSTADDGQRFRLLRPHARGGLGIVFVALDCELHREVALKQIHEEHADDPVSRQRFLLEAEVTGGLEHPGIVPVYSLGTYRDGRPYYAMRFVRGDSLKEAIERFHGDESLKTEPGRRSLEFQKLLRRFLDICNAVGYAHSRGVLHRDIKPGNVIVGRYGETLVVDWGLAKATGRSEPGSGERTLAPSSASGSAETLPGSALGTPAYMGPEQARGELDRLGPQSDVYSLGATLYCLLTGKPPLEGDAGDVLRKAQDGNVLPPRARDPSIDRALEAVCLKAMALEPEDRYASCHALAEDVERWLADEPVAAWREPFGRRALRWARRNRTPVAAAAVALIAGVLGLSAVAAVQARSNRQLKAAKQGIEKALGKSEESRRQAEAVSKFLVDAFRSPDPSLDGRQIKVADLLDRAVAQLDDQFAGDPRISAELLDAVGRTYIGLGLYPEAVRVHKRAWAVCKRVLGPEHPDTIRSMTNLARAHALAYRTAEGIPLLEQALRLQKATLGSDHPDTLESMGHLAEAYYYAGRRSEAIALLEQALKLKKDELGPGHPSTLSSMSALSQMYNENGRDSEAVPLLQETLKLQEAKLGPGNPDTIGTMIRLADALGDRSPRDECIRLLEKALKLSKTYLGPDDPFTLWAMTRLIDHYGDLGRLDDSIAMGEEALKLCRARLGRDNPHTLHVVHVLARAYRGAGRLERSIALSEEGYKLSTARLGPDHFDTIVYRQYVADAYVAAGRSSEAESTLRDVLPHRRKAEKPDSPLLAMDLVALGFSLLEQSRWPEAEPVLRECLAIREQTEPDRWSTFDTRSMLGGSLLGQGKYAEAEPLIVSGYDGLKVREENLSVLAKHRLTKAAGRVVQLYEAWGKPKAANEWKRKLGLADLPGKVFAQP